MKSAQLLFVALSFLLAIAAQADCPNLTGTWSCSGSDGTQSTAKVTQEGIPNGTLYRVLSNTGEIDFYADGKPRTTNEDGATETTVITCSGNSVLAVSTLAVPSEQVSGTIDYSFNLMNPNQLTTILDSNLTVAGHPPHETKVTGNCIRK